MKKSILIIATGLALLGSSCKKYLDINANPNTATSGTPETVLPQALVSTASLINNYNGYGSQLVGYAANAGGYGGFGASVTYDYSNATFSGLWTNTYDVLNDFQYVILQTDTIPDYGYFNGAAKIMKAYTFQLLVDTYNDVPYTEALQGINNLTPAYDKAEDIYKDLAIQLDSAIAKIERTQNDEETNSTSNVKVLSSSDPMFNGDMEKWIQFANTVKLRLIIRGGNKVAFSNTTFDPAGFLTTDAIVNPGYTRDNGKQNPSWTNWVFTYTGAAGTKSWVPTTFILDFYNGVKLNDDRGDAIYYQFPSTAANQLGFENSDVPASPTGSAWLSGANADADRNSGSAGKSIGIMKGPNAGQPILMASESFFLQSEAVLRTIIPGDAKGLFDAGILASYKYLYQLPDGTYDDDFDPAEGFADYLDSNPDSYLVHFELATSFAEQLEAIITQKYIALNFIHGQESWNEYRRTHYPTIVNGSSDANLTFASTQSISTRPDRLPTRILYPLTESSNNTANMPKGINPFSSFIFWALQ
jgi:hypothetical protein